MRRIHRSSPLPIHYRAIRSDTVEWMIIIAIVWGFAGFVIGWLVRGWST